MPVLNAETKEVECVIRHYCQPEKEQDMQIIADVNRKLWSQQDVPEASDKRDFGNFLGYRKRDIIFFNNYQKLPEPTIKRIAQFNVPAQWAYKYKLLESCGITSAQWHEQLRQDHIID